MSLVDVFILTQLLLIYACVCLFVCLFLCLCVCLVCLLIHIFSLCLVVHSCIYSSLCVFHYQVIYSTIIFIFCVYIVISSLPSLSDFFLHMLFVYLFIFILFTLVHHHKLYLHTYLSSLVFLSQYNYQDFHSQVLIACIFPPLFFSFFFTSIAKSYV